jgi:hypothetical protein
MFKTKKALEAEIKRLQEEVSWYQHLYEEECENNESYVKMVETMIKTNESLKKISDTLEGDNKKLLGLMKSYAKWDPMIIKAIKESGQRWEYGDGPATMYLKEVGEYHECDQGKTYGH